MKKIIGLDDGHEDNGVTSGKRSPVFPAGHKYAGRVLYENNFNQDVVNRLGKHLVRCNFDVLYTTPTTPTKIDTPLLTRTNLVNNTTKNSFNRPVDILISVHANALTGQWGTANGIETLWTKRSDEKLANVIHKHLTKGTLLRDRGVKTQNLHMTRESDMPACLVECCFMDNIKEAELLMSDEYRAECAEEIARGICEYFGVVYVEELKRSEEMSIKKYEVVKERISLNGNSLKFHKLNTDSGKATDVRHIVIPKGKAKFSLAYEKNQKTSGLVKSNKADLGINCTFYDLPTGIPSGYFKDSKGKVHSSAYGKTLKWTQINVGYDELTTSNLDTKRANASFQSAPLIVENGVACYEKYIIEHEVNSDIANSKRQRTFIWWDKQENVHIGIGDGGLKSNTFDIGLTVKEAALYALHHGAVKAVLLDGGGSTILADQSGGLNQSGNRGVNERVNHHALLITFKTDEELKSELPKTVVATASKIDLIDSKTGKKTELEGLIYEGKSYVELRKIADYYGSKVGWDDSARKATITK